MREAGEKMRKLQSEKYPVAAGKRLVGTMMGKFSDRQVAGFGHDPSTVSVGDNMTRQIFFCHEHQSMEEARKIMKDNGLQHLPVVDNNLCIIGIVNRNKLRPEKLTKNARKGQKTR